MRIAGFHLSRRLLAGIGLALALAAAAVLTLGGFDHLSGEYTQIDGPGRLEFSGHRVYVTTVLGMTVAATYETDGDRVIIKGGGGTQVYRRHGDTLDGGMGMKYVKKGAHAGDLDPDRQGPPPSPAAASAGSPVSRSTPPRALSGTA